MWGKQDKVWQQYSGSIIAADAQEALFLQTFMQQTTTKQQHVSQLEIVDIQKYKMLKQANKVRNALKQRAYIPFVFVVGKN
ncbi:MAG: hypothetical protein WCG87_03490 [Bacteroidota bacterium]